jgi:peptidoglycan LD-endopeptidase LytH
MNLPLARSVVVRNDRCCPHYKYTMRSPVSSLHRRALVALALGVLAACEPLDELRDAVTGETAHERYEYMLRAAGLQSTALGRDWIAAAGRSLQAPHAVSLPFRESGYLPPEEANAVAYRFAARRGERVEIEVKTDGGATPLLFVDLFAAADTGNAIRGRVASADSGEAVLRHEIGRDGSYVLRLQPELLRGGRFTITVRSGASLVFPVVGRDSRAVQSFWGANRDGGRRQHEGVDIFAPRGTPVIAAADGFVSRVGETRIGGKVVWLRDAERGQSLYYAHLDSQLVKSGQRVRIGDTLGLIGNTGNARGTPPHLHFGIYRRGEGAVDPYPFVHQPRLNIPVLAADTSSLGNYARVARAPVPLRAAPDARASTVASLERLTAVRLLGASGSWYRVALPDGTPGWVSARALESATRPVRNERVTVASAVLDEPVFLASVVDSIGVGAALPVHGRFADWLLVEAPSGRLGWLAND